MREIVVVAEQELADAIAGVVVNERLVVEGAGATAVAGALSGRVSSGGLRIAIVLSGANIDAGKLKLIAVASPQRLKDYPKVETVSETLPGVTSITWMAVAAPPGTPKEITKKISDAIGKGFKEADLQARIRKLQADPLGSTPEQMRDIIKQSLDTWEPVVKARKIYID